MISFKNDLKAFLNTETQYRECLFKRGYLFTDGTLENLEDYPFYSNWHQTSLGDWKCFVHSDQNIYTFSKENLTAVLIGHAYNPFTGQTDETDLLKDCIEAYELSVASFFDKVSEFTGIHVVGIINHSSSEITLTQDCCGMLSCFYGNVNGQNYITDYPQLVQIFAI